MIGFGPVGGAPLADDQTSGAATNNALTAGVGSFVITAQNNNFSDSAVYDTRITESGDTRITEASNARMLEAQNISAGAASYTLTGQDVALRPSVNLAGDAVSFTFTGQDADFTYVDLDGPRITESGDSRITESGDARVTEGFSGASLTAENASYALSGQAANFTLNAGAAQASYSLSGQDAAFIRSARLAINAGIFNVTGQSVTISSSAFAALSFVAGAPVLGTPSLTQISDLVANSIVSGSPNLGSPVSNEIHNLTPSSILTGAPDLGAPQATQVHDLVPNNILTGVILLDGFVRPIWLDQEVADEIWTDQTNSAETWSDAA